MTAILSGAHIHLLVNHVPIFGSILAVVLLIASRVFAGDVLRRTAFVVLAATALAAAAANYSGEPAEDAIKGFPGVTRAQIHEHEEVAENAFRVALVVGVLALGVLVRARRTPVPRSATVIVFIGAVAVCGMMVYAGLLGGRVRHTEVRPGAVPADAHVLEPRRTNDR